MTDTTLIAPKERRELVAARAARYITECHPGKELEIIVRPRKRERSKPQNNYLHGVAYKMLSDATGYEPDDIAEYLCGAYFGTKDKAMPGKRVEQVPIRTTTKDADGKRCVLSKTEFAEYVSWIQRFGAKHGVCIPDPDPEYFMADREAA